MGEEKQARRIFSGRDRHFVFGLHSESIFYGPCSTRDEALSTGKAQAKRLGWTGIIRVGVLEVRDLFEYDLASPYGRPGIVYRETPEEAYRRGLRDGRAAGEDGKA